MDNKSIRELIDMLWDRIAVKNKIYQELVIVWNRFKNGN